MVQLSAEYILESFIYSFIKSNTFFNFKIQLELCVKILSDVMELLFVDGQTNDGQFIVNEISEIMLTDLRTVIQTTIAMDRENVIVVSEF